jgi:hypothetical protein
MKRARSDLEPELEALLKPCKIQRQVPSELRARVLTRARAVVAGEAVPPVTAPDQPLPKKARAGRRRRLVQVAVAASVAMVAGAVGAVAALYVGRALTPEVPARQSASAARKLPSTNVGVPATDPLTAETESPAAARPTRPAHAGAKEDRFTAELALLQRAHAAYTGRDFSAALTVIAEHAHRFPKGPLAEQREALRVRSLAGAGRADEARRAAAAFAIRFPRSVLLPRVAEGVESPER